MNMKDIAYITDVHQYYPKKPSKAFRKCDGKTPYSVHPIWCAATIETEINLDEKTKEEGIIILLYHDILEDTLAPLPKRLPKRIVELIEEMTFKGRFAQEREEIWNKPKEIKLYKLYDKTNNLMDGSWMSEEKREQYQKFTSKLNEDVRKNYGELNITKIAQVMIK